MFQSLRHSHLVLRIGLALVFLWAGIQAFIDPQAVLDASVPANVQHIIEGFNVAPRDLMNLVGLFNVLVALSMATGFFLRWFAMAAAVYLVGVIMLQGAVDESAHDIGLLGGLVALILWPERSYA